jgi:hypothetical protein
MLECIILKLMTMIKEWDYSGKTHNNNW